MNICTALWSFVNFCCLSQSEVSTDNRKVSTFFAFQHVRCRSVLSFLTGPFLKNIGYAQFLGATDVYLPGKCASVEFPRKRTLDSDLFLPVETCRLNTAQWGEYSPHVTTCFLGLRSRDYHPPPLAQHPRRLRLVKPRLHSGNYQLQIPRQRSELWFDLLRPPARREKNFPWIRLTIVFCTLH